MFYILYNIIKIIQHIQNIRTNQHSVHFKYLWCLPWVSTLLFKLPLVSQVVPQCCILQSPEEPTSPKEDNRSFLAWMASTTGILAIAVASYSKKFQKTRPGHDISTGHPGDSMDHVINIESGWDTLSKRWQEAGDIHGKSFCLHHFWPVVSTHPKNALVDWGIIVPFLGKSSEPKIHQVIETYWNILKHIEIHKSWLKSPHFLGHGMPWPC